MTERDPKAWRALVAMSLVSWSVFAAIVISFPARWSFPAIIWFTFWWAANNAYDTWRVAHGKLTMEGEATAWYNETKRERGWFS